MILYIFLILSKATYKESKDKFNPNFPYMTEYGIPYNYEINNIANQNIFSPNMQYEPFPTPQSTLIQNNYVSNYHLYPQNMQNAQNTYNSHSSHSNIIEIDEELTQKLKQKIPFGFSVENNKKDESKLKSNSNLSNLNVSIHSEEATVNKTNDDQKSLVNSLNTKATPYIPHYLSSGKKKNNEILLSELVIPNKILNKQYFFDGFSQFPQNSNENIGINENNENKLGNIGYLPSNFNNNLNSLYNDEDEFSKLKGTAKQGNITSSTLPSNNINNNPNNINTMNEYNSLFGGYSFLHKDSQKDNFKKISTDEWASSIQKRIERMSINDNNVGDFMKNDFVDYVYNYRFSVNDKDDLNSLCLDSNARMSKNMDILNFSPNIIPLKTDSVEFKDNQNQLSELKEDVNEISKSEDENDGYENSHNMNYNEYYNNLFTSKEK